jgi:hypothetical protein
MLVFRLRRWFGRGALYVLAYAMGAPLGSTPCAAEPVPQGGTVTGKISYTGTVPPAVKRKLIEDATCAAIHPDGLEVRSIRVKDGGLADVLVYVKSGLAGTYAPPSEPVLIDQMGCEWFPRMVATMAGQPLKIRNSDHTSHNVHPFPKINKEFNIMQPRKGMESTKMFDKPELMIPLHCAAHPWMEAYISVLAHPFFSVTGEEGRFEIKGLPDGEYEIEAIHGELKSLTGRITVKGKEPVKLDLTYPPQKLI